MKLVESQEIRGGRWAVVGVAQDGQKKQVGAHRDSTGAYRSPAFFHLSWRKLYTSSWLPTHLLYSTSLPHDHKSQPMREILAST